MLTTFSGRKPSQSEYELRSFIALLSSLGVSSYLEIGAREGDTFHEVMTSIPGLRGVAVDLPGGLWGKSTTRAGLEAAVADLKSKGREASYIFGDSQTDATRRLVVARGPYDAVLIDGDHTLLGVSRDFDNYGHLVPVVAFHDIAGVGMREKVHGNLVEVPFLWLQLKDRYQDTHEFHEFVDEQMVKDGRPMGIGVMVRKEWKDAR